MFCFVIITTCHNKYNINQKYKHAALHSSPPYHTTTYRITLPHPNTKNTNMVNYPSPLYHTIKIKTCRIILPHPSTQPKIQTCRNVLLNLTQDQKYKHAESPSSSKHTYTAMCIHSHKQSNVHTHTHIEQCTYTHTPMCIHINTTICIFYLLLQYKI